MGNGQQCHASPVVHKDVAVSHVHSTSPGLRPYQAVSTALSSTCQHECAAACAARVHQLIHASHAACRNCSIHQYTEPAHALPEPAMQRTCRDLGAVEQHVAACCPCTASPCHIQEQQLLIFTRLTGLLAVWGQPARKGSPVQA